MNRFKSLCLVLCSLLLCLSGFSPVVSYAYEGDNVTSWQVKWSTTWGPFSYLRDGNWNLLDVDTMSYENGVWNLHNDSFDNVAYLYLIAAWDGLDFMYAPDVYDYYMVNTYFSEVTVNEFNYCPDRFFIHTYDCDDQETRYEVQPSVYHHDDETTTGHTVICKIPMLKNTSIDGFYSLDSNLGSIPANLLYEGLIIATPKSSQDLSSVMVEMLERIDSNTDGIEGALSELQRTIEEQYSVPAEEDFGVTDIVNQVNEKAGVLAVGTTTLVNFLDLFDSSNAGSTQLTFPGFSMQIQGTSYQIWNDIQYDLSELDTHFGGLMEVVRWATTMIVYMAVLNYLVRAFDEIFGSK